MTALVRAAAVTSKMLECHSVAKSALGEEFAARMREYGVALTKISEGKKISLAAAAVEAAQHMATGFGQIVVMAALAELLDPSLPEAGGAQN